MSCMLLSAVIAVPLVLVLAFLVFWLPEVALRGVGGFLGPRIVAALVGAGLTMLGVVIAARIIWRGYPPQTTSAGRIVIVPVRLDELHVLSLR